MKEASVSVTRKCDRYCAFLMKDVLLHFRQSQPAKCIDGQQSVVIEIDRAPVLVYSHGGRMIAYGGNCYLNETPVNAIIATREFVFGA